MPTPKWSKNKSLICHWITVGHLKLFYRFARNMIQFSDKNVLSTNQKQNYKINKDKAHTQLKCKRV